MFHSLLFPLLSYFYLLLPVHCAFSNHFIFLNIEPNGRAKPHIDNIYMSINKMAEEIALVPGLTQDHDDDKVNTKKPLRKSHDDIQNPREQLNVFYR